jgi:hypothetical protein
MLICKNIMFLVPADDGDKGDTCSREDEDDGGDRDENMMILINDTRRDVDNSVTMIK